MRQVIGYYDKTFTDELLARYDTKPDEFVGTKFQLCFGKVVDKNKLKEDIIDEDADIIDRMINLNIGTAIKFENNIATVMFEHPIPEDIYQKYYDNEAIFKEE